MKILYVTTIGSTMNFFSSLIIELIKQGNTVDIATNDSVDPVREIYKKNGCKIHRISCSRSPLSKGNLKAVKQIKKIVIDGKYDIVHCHTPVAAFCTRLACRKLRKNGLKVIYTAHGFHFFKGAPLKNWLIFYPIEKLCAHWTDILITINKEDFERAKAKLKAKKIEYVPGVGINIQKFADAKADKSTKRQELGVPDDAFVILSVGELNENKNHQTAIKALAQIGDPDIHYVIAGTGNKKDDLQNLAEELNVNLHLIGRRNDIEKVYKCVDINIFASLREGLGLAAIEGLASGLPLVCSDNRGTREYANKDNSFVCSPLNTDDFAKAICTLKENVTLRKSMSESAKNSVKRFSVEYINEYMENIYSQLSR